MTVRRWSLMTPAERDAYAVELDRVVVAVTIEDSPVILRIDTSERAA